jgi:chromate transport protein ChrA
VVNVGKSWLAGNKLLSRLQSSLVVVVVVVPFGCPVWLSHLLLIVVGGPCGWSSLWLVGCLSWQNLTNMYFNT